MENDMMSKYLLGAKTVFLDKIYVFIAVSVAVPFWITFNVFDQLLFFSPSVIFYMRDGAWPGFMLSTAAAMLTGIVVSMNIYALRHSISKSLGSLFSGSSVGVATSMCVSCSSIALFLTTSLGTAGLVVSTFLSNYQIHLRLLSIIILIWAYYSVHKKITASCSTKI
ncbi:MAG: hypothetical protein KGI19_08495 [Thaumarchaeota archaeon]|nr:hypothetical protein [Nitrososphaerota archaeon]